jgi:homocitrate synthase
LTGWNAIRFRADQLGLTISDEEIKRITEEVKSMCDLRRISLDDVDGLLYNAHHAYTAVNEISNSIEK